MLRPNEWYKRVPRNIATARLCGVCFWAAAAAAAAAAQILSTHTREQEENIAAFGGGFFPHRFLPAQMSNMVQVFWLLFLLARNHLSILYACTHMGAPLQHVSHKQ